MTLAATKCCGIVEQFLQSMGSNAALFTQKSLVSWSN